MVALEQSSKNPKADLKGRSPLGDFLREQPCLGRVSLCNSQMLIREAFIYSQMLAPPCLLVY